MSPHQPVVSGRRHHELKKVTLARILREAGCVWTICGGRSGSDWPAGQSAGMMGA